MKDAFNRAGQPWAGFIQHEGPSGMRAAVTLPLPAQSSGRRLKAKPEK